MIQYQGLDPTKHCKSLHLLLSIQPTEKKHVWFEFCEGNYMLQ